MGQFGPSSPPDHLPRVPRNYTTGIRVQKHFTAPEMVTQDWVGLSDKGLVAPMLPQNMMLRRGYFVAEFIMPQASGQVILNHQIQDGMARNFSVFCDPVAGISILHRRGVTVARYMLKGPLPQMDGSARLTFRFDLDADSWEIGFEPLRDGAEVRVATGSSPLDLDIADISAICACADRHENLLWFGFCQGGDMPKSGPWISQRTMIPTQRGFVAAGHLDRGDIVFTLDHGPLRLRAVHRFEVPARGSFAPVLLRAPFFAHSQDLLVSADQNLLISSGEVEYLFGTDSVLMAAKQVVDGRTALADERRAVISALRLDVGRPALIDVGGLVLTVGQGGASAHDYLSLNRFQVATLMAMLRRQVSRVA
jgi:hypothetical protein